MTERDVSKITEMHLIGDGPFGDEFETEIEGREFVFKKVEKRHWVGRPKKRPGESQGGTPKSTWL